ncbi:PAS domain-containing protein [Candidatus Nitrospira bockiana]
MEHSGEDAIEASRYAIWGVEREALRIVIANEAAIRHLGFSRPELFGMTLMDLLPADAVAAIERHCPRGYRSDLPNRLGFFALQKKDGTRSSVELFCQAMRMQGEERIFVLARLHRLGPPPAIPPMGPPRSSPSV